MTCGDSMCTKKYGFIGTTRGIRAKNPEKPFTYADAWKSFESAMTTARIPCTAIKRYPVVARWRDDVDYVQAGIYCFQPSCVLGELEPPANPLICPQFCVRFNDLDNIGITGRHYSGFIMLGIQVFNKPNDKKFWSDECVEFNFRWLTEFLCIPPEEITFIEDVWAGGGNLGPSIEYFVDGLEVGNMVFMQYKTFPDGSRQPLDVQVIDVGIGLERIPWLINGSATSYLDVFPSAFKYFAEKSGVDTNNSIWEKFGPLSCLLNVDEVDDLSATWQWIAEKIDMSVPDVRAAIEPIRDAYVVLDHTRTVMIAVQDGSLPANTGGGSNIRNVLRRAFAILNKNGWWEKFGVEGILELCEKHKEDLSTIYGAFPEYESFAEIISREYKLYKSHDDEQRKKLDQILKKNKGSLSLDDWIKCITSFGIPADLISQVTGTDAPGNLWYEIDYRQQQTMKAAAPVLYSTIHVPHTISLYDDEHDHRNYSFSDAKIVEVFPNVADPEHKLSVIALDKSPFYPLSGGQDNDTGVLTIDGTEYKVVDVTRVGPAVLHFIEPALAGTDKSIYIGKSVSGAVDAARRDQLRIHHTATHLVYATCRKVLGPHVWQNGARKKITEAHLDITHYSALTHEQVNQIEIEVNRAVRSGKQITKNTQAKDEAEKKYGFHLYQGGVVPGNSLRIVNIEDTDTEACCGTHCDNTAEVGLVKIIGARRVTDGIVRLTYVAGDRALEELSRQSDMIHDLCTNLSVQPEHVVDTATNFFKQALSLQKKVTNYSEQILKYQVGLALKDENNKMFLIKSDEATATLYISNMSDYVQQLKDQGKTIIFVGESFAYGIVGNPAMFDVEADFTAKLKEHHAFAAASNPEAKPVNVIVKKDMQYVPASEGKKGKKVKVTDIVQFQTFSLPNFAKIMNHLTSLGAFVEI